MMYERYTSRSGGMRSERNVMKERIRTGVILVLLAAVIVLSVFGGRAMSYQAEAHTTFVHRMQTECNSALNLSGSLSRTAGSSSSAILGRIRSHVYAMDAINQLNASMEGGYLVNNDLFTSLYAMLDDYSDKLITGMVTGELQTNLTAALTSLQEQTNQLK